MAIIEQLRRAVESSDLSPDSLAKAAGVSQPALSQFMRGKDIKLSAADRLAAFFGLELQPADPTAAAKSKVKAPAMPAVDWAETEPKKKRSAESPFGPPPPKVKRRK